MSFSLSPAVNQVLAEPRPHPRQANFEKITAEHPMNGLRMTRITILLNCEMRIEKNITVNSHL